MMQKPDAASRGAREMIKAVQPGRLVEGSDLVRRMSLLHEVLLHIDAAQTREDIIGVVRAEAKWIVDHDMCLMGLLNRAVTHYSLTVISAGVDVGDLHHKHFGIEEGMPGWVMRNHSAVIEDVESGPSYSSSIDGRFRAVGIKSLLIVPMRIENEVIGALTFGSKKQGVYSEIDSGLAQLFAHYFATAIRNAAIFEDVRKRISQIELINDVARKLTSQLNLEEVLTVAASSIQKSFSYFDVTVFLLSEDRSELILEAHSGNFVDFLPHGYRQKIGEGLTGWVGQHGERLLCNDVTQDARYLAYEYHNTRSELAIPIRSDGIVVGVLNVEDTKLHAFDETDVIVLETLSDQLGVAIRNAKLYEEIRKANMKLTELDKLKSEFLGIVSHDFRSPLSSIILAGKALLKNETVQSVKRVKDYLQIIVDQANRLNQLAEDTLSVTKIEAGRLSFHFKIVNLSRLIEDAIAMVRVSSRHEIQHSVPADVSFIKGDQPKLRQVIQNLVSNAVKYSPRGGKVVVTVEEYSPEQILLAVKDEGIGIPPEKTDKLFQKFSRVDSGEAGQIKGAGLGLWICREIVEAHGGRIWIESELGKGSTAKFTLNKAQEEDPPPEETP